MKLREELETMAADGDVLLQIFEALGFHVWFRYQKYREEFALDDVLVALDETPVGTFVEIEGADRGIAETAEALGRGPRDYLVDSYRRLYQVDCEARGIAVADMLFNDE
jgi:adenylate cyclase class 2